MTHHTPEYLRASSRAARSLANQQASDPNWSKPVWEARQEGIDAMEKLTLALIVLAGDLAEQLHAARAQAVLDNHAINAGAFEEEQLKRDVGE